MAQIPWVKQQRILRKNVHILRVKNRMRLPCEAINVQLPQLIPADSKKRFCPSAYPLREKKVNQRSSIATSVRCAIRAWNHLQNSNQPLPKKVERLPQEIHPD